MSSTYATPSYGIPDGSMGPTIMPNGIAYPPYGAPQAPPQMVPDEATKQGVVAAATAFNAKRRDDFKAHKESPETKWSTQMGDLIDCAVTRGHEGFLESVAQDDFYVGQFIMQFISMASFPVSEGELVRQDTRRFPAPIDNEIRMSMEEKISLAQYVKYSGTQFDEAYHEHVFKATDLDGDGQISFGEYFCAQAGFEVDGVLANQGGFPIPLAADGTLVKSNEALAKCATELLSPTLAKQVEVAFKAYLDGLRSKVEKKGKIEMVGMQDGQVSILERFRSCFDSSPGYMGFTPPAQDKAFSNAILAAQDKFMSVLLGRDRTVTVGCEVDLASRLWMANELQIFDTFDADSSGTLDATELSKAMMKANCPPGTDATGAPAPAPLYGSPPYGAPSYSFPGAPETDYEEIAKHFLDAFDVDSSGTISRSEWLVARAAFQSTRMTSSFYLQACLPTKPVHPVLEPLTATSGVPVAYPYDLMSQSSFKEHQRPKKKKAVKKKKTTGSELGLICAVSGVVCCAGIGGYAFHRGSSFTRGFLAGFSVVPTFAGAGALLLALCIRGPRTPKPRATRKPVYGIVDHTGWHA